MHWTVNPVSRLTTRMEEEMHGKLIDLICSPGIERVAIATYRESSEEQTPRGYRPFLGKSCS
ncbi:hypothetical protein M501DRAFT_995514 [Patellaria atrata CBS 101060]|uniref:Uncharacterized protein n=1 Tax=Patellaria atrata CBS 101060 TaxID=1346257 RepID=A0A9P4VII2_9PEZI|nr:hypothetical protein M501DRAFT_1004125 [Patellaria atrata CBS 101060]KAF2837560.1 hypothetical protein M501DRAFT_995514 [Patellaria atrata CBS 101060]